MKKNRANQERSLHSAGKWLSTGAPENIPVFLVLAIIILSASLLTDYRHSLQKNIASNPATPTEKYIWLTDSPEQPEGLYVFSPKQLQEAFPENYQLLHDNINLEQSSPVAAFELLDGTPRPIKLPPAVANVFFLPIPINRADKDILTSLPGIGPILAERIILRREQYGPFRAKKELLKVAGIGPKKFAALADRITLD